MTMKAVGKRTKRYDGPAHVSGETRFVDDIRIPGTLTVKVFRSPVVKGKIRNIDTSRAEGLAGVAGVITHRDIPLNANGVAFDQPVLAAESVRYKGEPIVAVAAEDKDTAMEALERIVVEIEEEEYVLDPLEAMKPGTPKVRPEGNIYMYGDKPYRKVIFGDIKAGFKAADHVIEGQYVHPSLEHAAMETQTSLSVPGANGKLTIYTQSISHYLHMMLMCAILQLPMSKVHFVGGTVGGSFGGKSDIHADHVTAVLALKTGRPVKWRWTREEEQLYSTHRGAWHISIKDGVTKDGRIIARQVRSIRDAGAYSSLNVYVVDKNCFQATGAYFIPNVDVEGTCVFTNKPPASAMRGFGVTPVTFSTEVQMNKIAVSLGMDPWEIRFINAYRNGDQTPTRRVLDSVAMIEVMQALAKKADIALPDKLKAMTSAERRETK